MFDTATMNAITVSAFRTMDNAGYTAIARTAVFIFTLETTMKDKKERKNALAGLAVRIEAETTLEMSSIQNYFSKARVVAGAMPALPSILNADGSEATFCDHAAVVAEWAKSHYKRLNNISKSFGKTPTETAPATGETPAETLAPLEGQAESGTGANVGMQVQHLIDIADQLSGVEPALLHALATAIATAQAVQAEQLAKAS